jgi:Tol biopolymer transport system component
MRRSWLGLVLGTLAATAVLGCGGGGGSAPPPPGPSNVIAFGAGDATGAFGLYLARPDGSEQRKLVNEPAEVVFPVWSPQGDRIAYLVRTSLEAPATLKVYSFQGGLTTTVSSNVRADVFGPTMSWNSDGKRLAFIDATSGGRLAIYDFDSAALAELPDVPATLVDWSPTDDTLAIVAAAAEDTDIYSVNSKGENEASLLQRVGVEGGLRWSPNGRLLGFWSVTADNPRVSTLFALPRDGGQPVELAKGMSFAWTADSQQVAYSGPAQQGNTGDDILAVAASGGAPQPISQSITRDRWPTWSPDGGTLAYNAQADSKTAFICVVHLNPESHDCLDLGKLLPGAPAWSPR